MSNLFVDTSGWANFFISNEKHHHLAKQCIQSARQQQQILTTSNYILTELVALLNSPLRQPRTRIIEIVEAIKTAPYIQVKHIDPTTDLAAWTLYKTRPDKAWSWVDCASFILMQQLNIQAALTTDHHFEQSGFIRLLK